MLQPAYQRGNSYQSVLRALTAPRRFQTFKDALTTDPRLIGHRRSASRSTTPQQSEVLHQIISTIGFIIAGLMGIGAVFGAVNTMYTAVASRTREIATLRALGFGSVPVVVSGADRGGAA